MNKAAFLMAGWLISLSVHAEMKWVTSLPDALSQAQAEQKAVLVDFTGSDWCGWCISLRSEVFDRPEFARFAQENLIMVELDYPRSKPQSPELKSANEKLAQEFEVQGYPTVFILDATGKRLLQTGYQAGGASNYIAMIQNAPGHDWKPSAPAPATPPPSAPEPSYQVAGKPIPSPVPAKTVVVPSQAAPVQHVEELTLKSIMRSGGSSIAILNNKNLSRGQTATFLLWDAQKNQDQEITVTCKEIRKTSILIQIEGEAQPRELKLPGKK